MMNEIESTPHFLLKTIEKREIWRKEEEDEINRKCPLKIIIFDDDARHIRRVPAVAATKTRT